MAVLALILVCAVAIGGFVISSSSGSGDAAGGASGGAEKLLAVEKADGSSSSAASGTSSQASSTIKPAKRDHDTSASEVLAIAGSNAIVSVELNDGSASTAPCAFDVSRIQSAVADIQEYGDCGFVFLDLGTGYGIAYNADETMYIASSSKVVLAHYALMRGAGSEGDYQDSIDEAIRYSDNDSYEHFGYAYADEGYGDWLSAHDAWFDNYVYDLYPPMSARSLASFWVEIWRYIQGSSKDAQWFSEALESTETSFIRNGIGDEAEARVLNKAGWIGEEGYESVTDAGIIEAEGHTYLMSIVTSQFDGEVTEEDVSALAKELFAVRDEL